MGDSPRRADRIVDEVSAALLVHPHVQHIRLVGSRATGSPVPLSDWDFELTVDAFDLVAGDLPALVAELRPIAQQWDPLGPPDYACYMLMLAGPAKIDLIFPGVAHEPSPPWEPGPDTLVAIDRHFWDWALWLTAKQQAGKHALVRDQLEVLDEHLLAPMGVSPAPTSIGAATRAYLAARRRLESRFGVTVPRALEEAVLPVLPG